MEQVPTAVYSNYSSFQIQKKGLSNGCSQFQMKNTITLNKVKVETCNGNQKNIHPGLKLIRQTSMPGKGLIQYSFVILFFLFTLFTGFVFCSKADPFLAGNAHNVNSNNSKMSNKI